MSCRAQHISGGYQVNRFLLLGLISILSGPSLSAAPVTLKQAKESAKVVVYEIPEQDGHEDAVRYIQTVRNQFYQGMELVDANAVSEDVLREKLKNGFVLYTVLNEKSRLLRLTTEPLNLHIESGTFRWNGLNLPLDQMRLVLVGRNPYGHAPAVVYAAGSSRLLIRAHHVLPITGPDSFYAYQGDTLAKQGCYSKDYEPLSCSCIKQAEARQDLDQFFSTLERVHPNISANVGQKRYQKLKQQTYTTLLTKADANGNIRLQDLAYELYYVAASLQDGHTSVAWHDAPSLWNAATTRFPPFRLLYDNGRYFLQASRDSDLTGMQLLAIDETPITDFLRPILDRCSGETQAFRATRFLARQQFWYWHTNLFADRPSFKVKLRTPQGEEVEKQLTTIGFQDYQKLPAGPGRQAGSTRVEFFDDGRIALFTYPAFTRSDEEKQKIAEIFQEVKKRKSEILILDLRGNGGGNSEMGDFIFSYLYPRRFLSFSEIDTKVSRDVVVAGLLETSSKEGKLLRRKYKPGFHGKPDAPFSGRFYLLIDNSTFSSATDLAVMFRDYRVGKILGYETGGVPSSFGDVYTFALDHSSISCFVSFKRFLPPEPEPGDDQHGVMPDVPFSIELLRDYTRKPDPGLAYTLDYVRKALPAH
jgi:hypothetical protein